MKTIIPESFLPVTLHTKSSNLGRIFFPYFILNLAGFITFEERKEKK